MGWFTNVLMGKQDDDPMDRTESANQSEVTPVIGKPAADPHHDSSGAKVLPMVSVAKVDPHLSSDSKQLELWLEVFNQSPFVVEVKRFEILGQSVNPSRYLKPGEKHEIKVYRGETPRNDYDNKVSIQYKCVDNGDYFQSDHLIEFKLETVDAIMWYIPCELHIAGVVRDI